MTYTIEYDTQAQKFLKKADKQTTKRIMDKVDELLLQTPVPHTAKSIVGEHGVFRVRIGDHRALYRVNYQEKKIIVFLIDKRGRVYD